MPLRVDCIVADDSLEKLQNELDKQERAGKQDVHVKLYEKGKEALRRKQEWANKQKKLLEEQELQSCSFAPVTVRSASRRGRREEDHTKSPPSPAPTTQMTRNAVSPQETRAQHAQNIADEPGVGWQESLITGIVLNPQPLTRNPKPETLNPNPKP